MPPKVNLEITKHAAQRMSQRGITNGFLSTLIAHADIETPINGGATALCVSMRQSRALNLNDRLHHYAVVLSAQSTILTVLKMDKGRKGARYRRRT